MRSVANALIMISLLLLISCGPSDASNLAGKAEQGTFEVRSTNIAATIEEEGEIVPHIRVEVKSSISGRVDKVFAEEGEYVERGQRLAEIVADRDQTRSINQIINSFQEAEINYENAKEDYEYARDLHENNFIPEREMRDALNRFRLAELRFESAQQEYRLALREIDVNTDGSENVSNIESPLTGIVLERLIEAGELVSAETSARSGTVLFNIADLSGYVVKAEINEFDIDRVRHGQDVYITRGRTGEYRYKGVVSKIAPLAVQRDGVRVYPVEIRIDDQTEALRFGMTAAVEIITARSEDALVIPVTSLFADNRGEEYVMVKQSTGEFERRPVQRGINNVFFVEIVSGLEEGEQVLSSAEQRMSAGGGSGRSGASLPGMPSTGAGHRR